MKKNTSSLIFALIFLILFLLLIIRIKKVESLSFGEQCGAGFFGLMSIGCVVIAYLEYLLKR